MPVGSRGREEGGRRQGPPAGSWALAPWPGPAPAPAGSGGLVLCLDRKINEFHYGIAILFHVSGSLRLTCSPGCDKPRHPRARAGARGLRTLAGHGAAEPLPCPARASRAQLSHADGSREPSSTCGGGKGQHQGSGTATVLSRVLKVLWPPKDWCLADRGVPSTALGGHVLPKNRLGGRKEVGQGGLGAFTAADDTEDLTRPMGCFYLTSARWCPHREATGPCSCAGPGCAVPGCAVPRRGAGCSPLIPPLRGRRQLALFAGGFAHSSSWVTRLRNLSGDRGSWEP